MFRYHELCEKNQPRLCFSDETYLCVCTDRFTRAECFGYDHTLDHCSTCLNGGRCVRGNRLRHKDFLCFCPHCYSGEICQFNTDFFTFNIDSLIIRDSQVVQIIYITLLSVIFLIGFTTNLFSSVTFMRPNPRKIGVGNYLLLVALISKVSLLCLWLKTIHIYLAPSTLLSNRPNMNNFLCKVLSYLLSVSTRCNYWLLSWITLERLAVIVFPLMETLKKPRTALVISVITILVNVLIHMHELFIATINRNLDGHIFCSTDYSRKKFVSLFDRYLAFVHIFIPFTIQVVSITLIIILTARRRVKIIERKSKFRHVFKKQFLKQKELYVTPITTIFVALPRIVSAITFQCKDPMPWQRYVLLGSYLSSYIPQLLGFIIHVLPSTVYKEELFRTRFGKMLSRKL